MDAIASAAWQRVPLAEAVLTLWRFAVSDEQLEDLFQRLRRRCYTKVLQFPVLVQLMHDALLVYRGSGRQSFERAEEDGRLTVSIQAAFGKLRRVPLGLSEAFLAECTDRLREAFPNAARQTAPASLGEFHVSVLDGKAIKHVAKRLQPLRGRSGGVLGGRALVAMDFQSGLAVAMRTDRDGDANDVKFVPNVLPEVRRRFAGPRLWLADRQFADLVQTAYFTEEDDHFLVRYNKKLKFHEDSARPAREGRDASGRQFVEDWGWIGGPKDPRRRPVRRITLFRPGEEAIVLLTDLLNAEQYPAADLLALYAERWGIERMFQQVTEVFHLQTLIGGSSEATVFQFAFCLLLYNMIQVVRASIATIERRDPDTISTEKLFLDVERELTACTVLWEVEQWTARVDRPWWANEVKSRLRELFRDVWSDRWLKAKTYRRRPHPAAPRLGVHVSVHRILLEAKQKRAAPKRQ
ncbi:MAG: transposase [Thermoguttaceae bacterium]